MMIFRDKIIDLSNRIPLIKKDILLEENSKHYLILPFLKALGYDYTDPRIVKAEYQVNAGKVDYVVDYPYNRPVILIEVKHHSVFLKDCIGQLSRYFNSTAVGSKFGILTNGIEYQFFTDLDDDNLLDAQPFMVINLDRIGDDDIYYLEKFVKDNFDVEQVKVFAREKKYSDLIKNYFKKEFENPSDGFIDFVSNKIKFRKMNKGKIKELIIGSSLLGATRNLPPSKDILVVNSDEESRIKEIYEEWHFYEKNEKIRSLYKKIRDFLIEFENKNNKFELVPTKLYFSFRKNGKIFCAFRFRKDKIMVFVKDKDGIIKDIEGFVRDVSKIGHHPPANIEITVSEESQIEEVKKLIKFSYDKL